MCDFLYLLFLSMTTFVLNEFVANPSVEQLCKKCDLYEIARNYELPVSTAWVKGECKAAILTGLVDQGVSVVPGSDSPGLVAAREDPSLGCKSSWPPAASLLRRGRRRCQGQLILLLMWGELGWR